MAYRVCKSECRMAGIGLLTNRRENRRPRTSPSSSMHDSLRSAYVKHTKQEEEVFSPNENLSSGLLLLFVLMSRTEEFNQSDCSRGHHV